MASENQKNQDETTIDKVNSQLTEAGTRIAANKKILAWGIGGVLIIAVLVLGYIFIYSNPRTQKAIAEYNKVEMSSFGNDSIAGAQYKAVADKYGSTDAGKLAALSAAESLYNTGNYEEAVKYLNKFSCKDAVLEANAMVLTGDCYVNLKKYDEALGAYSKAIRKADRNPQIVPRVLLKEANIYDAQQKYDKALECYKEIKKNYPEFQLGNGVSIDAYIARENARLGK